MHLPYNLTIISFTLDFKCFCLFVCCLLFVCCCRFHSGINCNFSYVFVFFYCFARWLFVVLNKIYCIKKIISKKSQVRSNKNLYQISKGNSKNHFTFFSQLFRNEGMYGNYVTEMLFEEFRIELTLSC